MKDEQKTRQQLLEDLSSLRGKVAEQEEACKELGGIKASVSRLARLFRALSRINETIVSVLDPVRLPKEICRIMVEDAGFLMSWIGFIDPKTLKLPATAHWGNEQGYLKNISISVNGEIPEGKGPTGTATRESRPFICNDIQNDPIMAPWRAEAIKRGYLSSAAFPITDGIKTIGALSVYAGESGFFNDQEVFLLKAFTSNIFYAIEAAEHVVLMKRVERELQRERDFIAGIIENVGALLLVLDLDGKIVSFNSACEKITGYSFNEVRDRHFWDLFIIPEEQELIGAEFRKLTKGDLPSSMINYWLTRSGEKRLISWRNTYLSDGDGNVEYIIASGVDITEQKKSEDTLRNAAEEWKRTFDSIPDLIMLIDLDNNITRVNKAAINAIGLPEEKIIDAKCYSLIYPSDCPHVFCPHALTVKDGKEHVEEIHEPTMGRDFMVTTTPVTDDSGRITGSVHVMRDITERNRSEGILRAALDESKERAAETAALIAASRAVLESKNFHDAAVSIYHAARDLIGAKVGYIALQDASGETTQSVYMDPSIDCNIVPGAYIPIHGLREKAFKGGKSLYQNDFPRGNTAGLLPPGHIHLDNVLFSPLLLDGQSTGLLALGNKPGGFTEKDAVMASTFSKFVAVALQNSRAEELLEHSEARFRSVAQSATDAIVTVDSNGEIVFWNNSAAFIFGYSEQEALGKDLSLILPDKYHLRLRKGMEQVIKNGAGPILGKTTELQGLRKGGLEFPLELSLSTWTTAEGMFFTGIVRDITERKIVEENLNMAFEDSRRREAETEALLKASKAVLENHKFDDAAKTIFQICKELVGAQAGYIALLSDDHSENEVSYLDVGNTVCTVPPDIPMPIRGFRALAYKSTKAIFENNFSASEWTQYLPEGHAPLNNVLFAPLIIDGQHVGLLGLGNKPEGFNENDARMATAAAEFAAIALKNSGTLEALASSEERFRSVAQTASDALVTVDDKGKIIFWNTGAEAIFGYKSDEAIGKQVTVLIPEKSRNEHINGMARLARTGISRIVGKTTELRGLRKNGHEFPLELSLASWRTTEGDFYTAIIRDITKRKEVEETLRKHQEHLETLVQERTDALLKNERKYRKLFENAHVGMVLSRRDTGEIIDVNNKYTQMLGFTRNELIGKPAKILYVDPSERDYLLQMLKENGSVSDFETRLYAKTGEIKSISTSIHVSEESDQFLEGTMVDVTERRKAEEDKREAELRLEEQRAAAIHSDRLRSLGEMAAGIAHELNQPLLGVRGLAEHIVIGMDRGWNMTPEKIRDKINLIIAQSDRMTHIIEHVRIFAREAGSVETMPVNVNEVVNSCVGMIGTQMNARGFILECNLADNLPAVLANPFSLEEVIFNLITNARDALAERTPGGSPNALRITLRTFVDGDDGRNVIIQVCDEGAGIPDDILQNIFDPFFTTKASSKGTGLGLPIARNIIESFSGTIDIESEVGKGTTVTISLPPMGE